MGKLIVIEGLDGSGKATQTKLLYEKLNNLEKQVQMISFPNYESQSSVLVKMYLGGEFGDDPGDVNAYAASAFYAVDRFASYKQNWGQFYHDGGIVLCDRYTTSNAIHQCAKLPQSTWNEYTTWLNDFEHNRMNLPKPDGVIYLDVETHVSQKLMDERYKDGNSYKDIHEKNMEYLQECQKSAGWCANKFAWKTITCSKNGKMKDIKVISDDVWETVSKLVL